MEKVSIILPTYNGGSKNNGLYLKKAIESVLNQSYENLELIIINDGSKDNSEEICKNFTDTRIKYIYQENKGLSGARNTGIKNSTGEYLCFLDDDDILYKTNLEEKIKFLQANNKNVVYSFADKINENDLKIAKLNYAYSGNLLDKLLYKNTLNSPCSVLISKSVIDEVGYFKEYLYSCEDWDYWLRIANKFEFYCIEKELVGYRIHSTGQMSRNREKMEFYDYIVLSENLLGKELKEKSRYLENLYKRWTRIDYGIRDFDRFRENYKLTKVYGSHNLEWKIKYLLSYFPSLVELAYKFKNK